MLRVNSVADDAGLALAHPERMWHGLPAHENTAKMAVPRFGFEPVAAKPQAKPDWLCFGFVFSGPKSGEFLIFTCHKRAYIHFEHFINWLCFGFVFDSDTDNILRDIEGVR